MTTLRGSATTKTIFVGRRRQGQSWEEDARRKKMHAIEINELLPN
jgi:hypothetical protein